MVVVDDEDVQLIAAALIHANIAYEDVGTKPELRSKLKEIMTALVEAKLKEFAPLHPTTLPAKETTAFFMGSLKSLGINHSVTLDHPTIDVHTLGGLSHKQMTSGPSSMDLHLEGLTHEKLAALVNTIRQLYPLDADESKEALVAASKALNLLLSVTSSAKLYSYTTINLKLEGYQIEDFVNHLRGTYCPF